MIGKSEYIINFFEKIQVQEIIKKYKNEKDINKLAFKRPKNFDLGKWQLILWHLQNLQKVKNKIPLWSENPKLTFPFQSLPLEQSSSQATAYFKSQLISGKTLVDLTGGLGVDTFFLAQNFQEVYHIEKNTFLQKIVKYNFQQLEQKNVFFENKTAEDFLKQNKKKIDFFYIDPSRRNINNQKLIALEDYSPNIIALLSYLQESSLLLKISPMISIQSLIVKLPNIQKIWALAIGNEVKEVLALINFGFEGEVEMSAVKLDKNGNTQKKLSFLTSEEKNALTIYSQVKKYLYEAHKAILKLGAFKYIAQKYNLTKLHPNSQLHTSEKLQKSFFGKIFEVIAVEKFEKKTIFKHLNSRRAWIVVRNFPITVDDIRQKWKIKEGGEKYLYFTTNYQGKHIVIIAKRLK